MLIKKILNEGTSLNLILSFSKDERFPKIKNKYVTTEPKQKLKKHYQKSDILMGMENDEKEAQYRRKEVLKKLAENVFYKETFVTPGPGYYDINESYFVESVNLICLTLYIIRSRN